MASLIKRGEFYYIQYYVGGKARRTSTHTGVLQLAKEKIRQLESAQHRGDTNPLPTRTPLPKILASYVQHVRSIKTAKSAQTDIYYLRDVFGPICPDLEITSRKIGPRSKKRPPKPGQDRRRRSPLIEASCMEQITTAQVFEFISGRKQSRGLAAKTANRYREILCRLFNWAMEQKGVQMPGGKNPAAAVERYQEPASEIRFLTLQQIQEQLDALADKPQLQAMIALMIYAGLRREEVVWLCADDVDLAAANNGMIRVRAKTVDGESWQPKTKVNRAVPISRTLRHYLDRYVRRHSQGDWFFPSPEGKHWDPDNFSSDLRDANKKKNLVWGSLDYRHTFGSQLAMKGESLYKISQLMGNSPEICRRHYAALLPESLLDSVEFGSATTKQEIQAA